MTLVAIQKLEERTFFIYAMISSPVICKVNERTDFFFLSPLAVDCYMNMAQTQQNAKKSAYGKHVRAYKTHLFIPCQCFEKEFPKK